MIASLQSPGKVGLGLTLCLLAAAAARADEIQYLPNAPHIVVSFDFAAIRKSKTFNDVRKQIPNKDELEQFDDSMRKICESLSGISFNNVARLTAGMSFTGKDDAEENVSMVSTIQPVTVGDIKAKKTGFLFTKVAGHKEVKVGAFTLHQEIVQTVPLFGGKPGPARDGSAFCLVEPKMVLYGEVPVLKKILERKTKPALSANVQAGLKEAGSANVASLVIDIQGLPPAQRAKMAQGLIETFPEAKGVADKLKYLVAKVNDDGSVKGSAAVVCTNAAGADDARKLADAMLADMKKKLVVDPRSPSSTQKAVLGSQTLLNAVKLSVQGDTVAANADIEHSTLTQAILAVITADRNTKKQ